MRVSCCYYPRSGCCRYTTTSVISTVAMGAIGSLGRSDSVLLAVGSVTFGVITGFAHCLIEAFPHTGPREAAGGGVHSF